MKIRPIFLIVLVVVNAFAAAWGQASGQDPLTLTDRLHHLRVHGEREWSSFPAEAEGPRLELKFNAASNTTEYTLVVRQQDVKDAWRVQLNGKELGRLVIDENDMVLYFAIPTGTLRDGQNEFVIEPASAKPKVDDIRAGEIRVLPEPRDAHLGEANILIDVTDGQTGQFLPSRITIIDQNGSLQTVGTTSNESLAIRPGVIYTSTGKAELKLPAGQYRLYAGRGFEYSLAKAEFAIAAGETKEVPLQIRREVPTGGYVACDTHVHTLTHSGHGDATIEERMITLAGEGIELPIATDHNRQIDYEPISRQLGVRRYFTPVTGNEVTTSLGHFNVFPAVPTAAVPDHRGTSWNEIFTGIQRVPDVKAVILNHARDLHTGVRPFGPKLRNEAAGANIAGWKLQANAMEIVISGTTQNDPLQLTRDWMTQLNHGQLLTPVGSSDSHDVARHFVGQGRTYIRARDDDPAAIHVDEAVDSFIEGRVVVSYGLLAELTVDDKYGSGELAALSDDELKARVRVLGPHWAGANKVMLFQNGELIREEELDPANRTEELGVIAQLEWTLPRPAHDAHLVVVAVGPGIRGLYWPTAKPYQPTSPEFEPVTFGCSGAIWLDGDGNGRKTPAVDYARIVTAESDDNLRAFLDALKSYDEAIAVQAAHLWQEKHRSLLQPESLEAIRQTSPHVRDGFTRYLAAWRENEMVRDR